MNQNHEILETEDALDRLIYGFKELIKDKNKDIFQFKDKTWKLTLKEVKISSEFNIINLKSLEKILESIESKKSTSSGTVFTPSWITETMVDYTLDQWIFLEMNSHFSDRNMKTRSLSLEQYFGRMFENKEKEDYLSFTDILFNKLLRKVKILDPCVGGGAFITSLIQKICKIFTKYYNLNDSEDSKEKITKICNFITDNIFFADLNNYSLEITKIRIKSILITLFSREYRQIIDAITFHSYLGNTLTNFGKDFPIKFHIIFGNPPYISSDNIKKNISQKTLNKLKENYSSVIKKGSKPDLYFYFLRRAVDHLEEKGFLSFIIPNRVLSNDYATKLRFFLLQQCDIQLIVDFNPKIQVFPGANVHPCIITITNRGKIDIHDKKQDHHFYSALIKDESILKEFNLYNIEMQEVSQDLSDMYNIFFTEISEDMQKFLIKAYKYHQLKSIIKIHEGTRVARFQHKFPPTFQYRITAQQWYKLSKEEKKQFIGEIRGKDIERYIIGKSRQYLALPELLESVGNIEKKNQIIAELIKPTVYIRELGKKLFAGLKSETIAPLIAYGGVYFFKEDDINFKVLKQLPNNGILLALLVYLSSNVVLNMYRALYNSSAWGNALKFRSSYLYKLPLILFDNNLFSIFGLLLTKLHLHNCINSVENQKFVIDWIEEQISICLIGSVICDFGISKEKGERNTELHEYLEYIELIKEFIQIYLRISTTSFSTKEIDIDCLVNNHLNLIQEIEKNQIYSFFSLKIRNHPWFKMLA